MDITKAAVAETSTLHVLGADDEPLFEDDARTRPVTITLYGPGSRAHRAAKAAALNRGLERGSKRGKIKVTASDLDADELEMLVACTIKFEGIEHPAAPGETGEALFRAVYGDPSIGFIRDQVLKHIGEWGNFSRNSATS